ncbi:MAG: IS110 family transposase [Deltaproteobacteria bacterium]|nr:IS110 family transposase [Deltaproteobacteria bacterium]
MNDQEISRIEHFRQFKKTIRASKDYLIVGLDIAKDRHVAFMGTAQGRTLRRRIIIRNDISGYNKLLEESTAVQKQHGLKKIVFGLEPTGNYHKPLARWLIMQNHELVMVSGKSVKENRQLLDGRWDKNDTKDSANVADLISQGKCQFFANPGKRVTDVRDLLSLRRRLKRQEHGLRMRIRNSLLSKHFPEMDRYWGSRLQENLAIIRWCLDPQKIATMPLAEFIQMVTRTDRGLRQVKRLQAIHRTAAKSVGLPVTAATRFEARLLVEELERICQKIAQLQEEIKTICNRCSHYKLLQTIPGVGPFIAAVILAAIGNPHRFANRSQVIRLAGLDLSANRSGKSSDKAVPVLSKKGDASLRYALYQAALIATYHNDRIKRLFRCMLEGRERERGIRTKMRVKLASKILIIAWSMMKTNSPFDPDLLDVKAAI